MKCTNCNAELAEDSVFCSECGTKVESTPTPAPTPEETPVVEKSLAVEETPAIEESPAVEETPAVEESPVIEETSTTEQGDTKKFPFSLPSTSGKNNFIGYVVLGVAAIAVIVLIVLVCNLLFGKNYKTPIQDMEKMINSQSTNVKDYYKLAYGPRADFYYEYSKLLAKIGEDEDAEDWEDNAKDTLEDLYDNLEDQYGDKVKCSLKIKEKDEISDSKLDDYQDGWEDDIEAIENIMDAAEDNDDYSKSDIKAITKLCEKWIKKFEKMEVKKGYELEVEATIKGDDKDDSDDTEITVLKIGDQWVMDDNLFY